MIRFEGVTKRYPDGTVAVDDLSLEVPQGGITCFVGPSGCGKTTSLRMINRMVEPTEGRILLHNEDVADRRPAQLRRSIGYVIQHAGLFPHRTVLANVMTVPRLLGWDRRQAREAAHQALEKVGLTADQAKRYPSQLSGGQQQRVGVARALASDPEVVLMDEPFSAVDPLVRADLQDEVRRLQRELGITVVMVTHDIDEALHLGDHVAVMRQGGRLAQLATPAELLARPVDDFVASFVGKDRGYRALGFEDVALSPEPPTTVRLGARAEAGAGWTLVTDDDGHPLGWADVTGWGGQVTEDRLLRFGNVARVGDSARGLLDAALSSPSGQGVVVDEDGRLAGVVSGEDVLAALARARQGGTGTQHARASQSGDDQQPDQPRPAARPLLPIPEQELPGREDPDGPRPGDPLPGAADVDRNPPGQGPVPRAPHTGGRRSRLPEPGAGEFL